MTSMHQFQQAIHSSYKIVKAGSSVMDTARFRSPAPETSISKVRAIQQDTILFGMADDRKPLLLSLTNPDPGAILVTSDRSGGKTHFLRMLILAAERLKKPGEVRFVVLTCYPQDFVHLYAPNMLEAVYTPEDEQVAQAIYQLASSIEKQSVNTPVMLLIDGLEAILQLDPISQENLAYILAEGPAQIVWPIVTANADMIVEYPEWLACFRTRMYGRVNNPRTAQELTPIPGAPLDTLIPAAQYCIRENHHWLKFWLPTLPNHPS